MAGQPHSAARARSRGHASRCHANAKAAARGRNSAATNFVMKPKANQPAKAHACGREPRAVPTESPRKLVVYLSEEVISMLEEVGFTHAQHRKFEFGLNNLVVCYKRP